MKILVAISKYILVIAGFVFCTAGNFKTVGPTGSTPDTVDHVAPDSIIHLAGQLQGIKYRYGGMDLSGFDCSGFTSFVYKMYHIILPRSSREQYSHGRKICDGQIRKADLLFFKGRNINSQIVGHVGIAISNWHDDNVIFIHASSQNGIKIENLRNSYFKRRYIGAARVLFTSDIQAAEALSPFNSK